MVEIIRAHSAAEFKAAADLFRRYAAGLQIDLGFQHFEDELRELPQMYGAPEGSLLLARNSGRFVGCIALRNLQPGIGEVKRMYVTEEARGKGFGRQLLTGIITLASAIGYERLRLDTLAGMKAAIALYTAAGFSEIEPYYFNPEKNAVFFEKLLR